EEGVEEVQPERRRERIDRLVLGRDQPAHAQVVKRLQKGALFPRLRGLAGVQKDQPRMSLFLILVVSPQQPPQLLRADRLSLQDQCRWSGMAQPVQQVRTAAG